MNCLKELPFSTDFGELSYGKYDRPFEAKGRYETIYEDYTCLLKLDNILLKKISLGFKDECEKNQCELCDYINGKYEFDYDELNIENKKFNKYWYEIPYFCTLVPEFNIGNLKAIVQEFIAIEDHEYWFQVGYIEQKNKIVYFNASRYIISDAIQNAKVIEKTLHIEYSECYSINFGEIKKINLEPSFKRLYDLIIKHSIET